MSEDVVAFDLIGERYEEEFDDRGGQVRAGEWLLERLDTGARILDLGCGSGRPTAEQLVTAGAGVVGIDASERMLELARAHVPGADFRRADMRDLDDTLRDFHAVTAFFSLLMLSRDEIASVLRALRHRLQGPKLLVLSMIDGDFDAMPISFMGVQIPVSAYPVQELRKVVTDAGYTLIDGWECRVEVEPGRVECHQYLCATVSDPDA